MEKLAAKLSRGLIVGASCLLFTLLATSGARAQARPKPKPRPEIPHDKPIKKVEPIRMEKKKGGLDNVKPLKPDFDKAVHNVPDRDKGGNGTPPEKEAPRPPPPQPPKERSSPPPPAPKPPTPK